MVLPVTAGVTWYDDVIDALGLSITEDRAQVLALWARSEGMPADAFNWLAATDKRPGSTSYNSAGVQQYPSYNVGVQVVVDKLSSALYAPILDGLKANDALRTYDAINASPWCHGCQGGHYPIALHDWLQAGRPGAAITDIGAQAAATNQTGNTPDSWDPVIRWVGQQHTAIGQHLVNIGTAIGSLTR